MIVPEEADIIKPIYREYLEGASLIRIVRGLEKDNILMGAGKPTWRQSTFKKILSNEKYIGDALLQKTYTIYKLYVYKYSPYSLVVYILTLVCISNEKVPLVKIKKDDLDDDDFHFNTFLKRRFSSFFA